MKVFLKNNLGLIGAYALAALTALFYVINYDKKAIHLYLNSYVGNPFADTFFALITYLGDGTVAVIILLLLIIFNMRLGIYATASFLASSLTSIGLKHLFFDDENRPFYVFNFFEHIQLKLVDGVHVYIHNSFPSGHATQAFAIFMCLAFYTKNQVAKFLLLILALLTAYSRVHLSQHWLNDITAGSVVGFTFSLIFYYAVMANPKFNTLNKSLFVFIRYWRSK